MSYTKENPFLASVIERTPLSRGVSLKNTQHIVLDIKSSGLIYQVGDSVGIYPKHSDELVKKTIQAIGLEGDVLVSLRNQDPITLRDALSFRCNITEVSPKFLQLIGDRQSNEIKKSEINDFFKEGNREQLKAYLESYELWDLLENHNEVHFQAQEIVELLKPLLPRFYSIASSQNYVGDQIHLTVAPLEYESNGNRRRGICTHYLCETVDLNQSIIPIFFQPANNFRLPENHETDLIMIGPGTGVAPFRAFLQERLLHAKAKGRHWLFFGERNRDCNFFYENDWSEMEKHGHLRVDVAFSRDQEHKVYVQHRLLEHGEEIYQWIQGGAHLYVCGDAQRMAKDVEEALLLIIQRHGGKNLPESREYLKQLRKSKRYLRDVY